jgi:hypothetical protein
MGSPPDQDIEMLDLGQGFDSPNRLRSYSYAKFDVLGIKGRSSHPLHKFLSSFSSGKESPVKLSKQQSKGSKKRNNSNFSPMSFATMNKC